MPCIFVVPLRTRFPRRLILLSCIAWCLPGKEFSSEVVDGLSRPLSDVLVTVECIESRQHSQSPRGITLLQLRSDPDGMIHGQYDSKAAGCDDYVMVKIAKDGYAAYSTVSAPTTF